MRLIRNRPVPRLPFLSRLWILGGGTFLLLAPVPLEAAAMPAWISPHALASQVPYEMSSVNRTFRLTWDGDIQPGQVVSVASIAGLDEVAPNLTPGAWVMYDIERWEFTPLAEQAQPYRAMRSFVRRARAYGFRAILAPGWEFRKRGARRDADAFVAQVQRVEDPAKYRAEVCRLAADFDGPLYAELAANGKPGHDATGLYRQWRAGRACTQRFAVWAGDVPDAERIQAVTNFFGLVYG